MKNLITFNNLNNSPSALVLGDNLFHGENLGKNLEKASEDKDYSTVFAYKVSDPERYGVVEFNNSGGIRSIEEKPINPKTK